jgi:nucleoside-diphosphate-sugar epimerase
MRHIRFYKQAHVVHLAAKTGVDEKQLSKFAANIDGLENMVRILRRVPSVKRAIFTSSLLVCRMGYMPKNDADYIRESEYRRIGNCRRN